MGFCIQCGRWSMSLRARPSQCWQAIRSVKLSIDVPGSYSSTKVDMVCAKAQGSGPCLVWRAAFEPPHFPFLAPLGASVQGCDYYWIPSLYDQSHAPRSLMRDSGMWRGPMVFADATLSAALRITDAPREDFDRSAESKSQLLRLHAQGSALSRHKATHAECPHSSEEPGKLDYLRGS